MIVYDLEIRRAVQAKGDERMEGVEYCKGWTDYAGMGISCLVAFDCDAAIYRVFMGDNLSSFNELANRTDRVVGFNNITFDDQVCMAAGVVWQKEKSIDLARLIWRAAGIPEGEHPKGLSLDAICQANKLGGKTGNGLMAPVMFQRGEYGGLIDYCVADVGLTLKLYRRIFSDGGIIDPRDGKWLRVCIPR